MTQASSLGRGVNFGGWLSQAPQTDEHRSSFITQADFQRIADWGFDNVRLPFDHLLLCPDGCIEEISESGLAWLDTALSWAEQHGLKAILDMHSLPGFNFMDPVNHPDAVPPLFTDAATQQAYFGLWKAIARRYSGRFPGAVFELANEIAAPDPAQWNELAAGAVRAIREVDADRAIVVGSNCWNVCSTFVDLAPIDDLSIIYNFHFYNPFPFTHQKASWSPEMVYYGREVSYPGRVAGLREAAERALTEGKEWVARQLATLADLFEDRISDQGLLEELMEPAFAFARMHNVPLYCGEFGVVSAAGLRDKLNWFRDVLGILNRRNVAWSMWSYKGMDFGIVDENGVVISEEIQDLLRGMKT